VPWRATQTDELDAIAKLAVLHVDACFIVTEHAELLNVDRGNVWRCGWWELPHHDPTTGHRGGATPPPTIPLV
jgi:hypothetical protein